MTSSESDDESISSVEEKEDVTQEERDNIRSKLSTMSLEDLLKLKQEMGLKLYDKTVHGINNSKRKTTFKRANKNRPREMSSKKQKRFNAGSVEEKMKQPQQPRDPRFDPLCGAFDSKTFKSNYKFVNNIRKKEKANLEKQLNEVTDPVEKNNLKYVVQRLGNQIREQENKERKDQQVFEEKRDIKEKLKKGEKPIFKKKSVKRVEDLIKKYEELKNTNRLRKHIEKKSKRLSAKERRKMESQNLDV